ncbi:50S ribosomal protein L23 [Patescibacteria group bacterium]|nr:50S ribosomal protein L23 [Patescibacteria group bacterium]
MSLFSRTKKEIPKKDEKEEPKKVVAVEPKEKKTVKKEVGKALGVLIKPLITEKSSFLSPYGQYVFEVALKTNKIEIAKAIERAYGVKPVSVNIIHVRGKKVRYGKTLGVTKKWKKAIITLKPGDKIEVYEGV